MPEAITDYQGRTVVVGEPVCFVDGVSVWARWERRRGGAWLDGVTSDGRALVAFRDGSPGIAVHPRAIEAENR